MAKVFTGRSYDCDMLVTDDKHIQFIKAKNFPSHTVLTRGGDFMNVPNCMLRPLAALLLARAAEVEKGDSDE